MPAATTATLSAPPIGLVGVQTGITIALDGTYTGEATFSDNGYGGAFTPVTRHLDWTNSSVTQTIGYQSNLLGIVTISATFIPLLTVVGSPAHISISATEIISAIQAWFAATAPVNSLMSTPTLWHKQAPETVLLPYATVFLVSEPVETWTTGFPMLRSTVQVNLHANLPVTARSIGRAFRSNLKGAGLIIGGSSVMHVLPVGSAVDIGEGLGPNAQDCWVAMETFDILWTEDGDT